MVKTVSLPDIVYSELVSIAGELTILGRKPISLGMTVAVLSMAYKSLLEMFPQLRQKFQEILQKPTIMSPEEFEKTWDSLYKEIAGQR